MTEETGHEDHEHHPHESTAVRSTAPQSGYTGREIVVGVVVALVGLAVTFGVPLAVLLLAPWP
ncbi:uncharacterized protein Nmlp_1744 [Natronomonas moolapensis 8.8.11]|uniref:Uncharacterized protein n=1 Tax=Natronomonas moolapensis (strain DSM 18674 / CECT 7526 / JCM 14361 / 8.8.11) TaxID=268739 RepID=M1XPH3_NATM8|nr:hypothetical protein [Natronomonas moolapensis]CCQ35934.1 uncharacterized protein Nmlp_1744 [Natronomonas moolapensis 8.8.11]